MKISVTGIIGVIGSGKDTYKNSVIDNSEHCIVGDFSDGVREFVSSFIGFPISSLNEEEYRCWKDNHAVFVIGRNNLPNSKLTGRRLLENVGKTLRRYDNSFWANYCTSQIYKEAISLKDSGFSGKLDICFGSVRYAEEARSIFDLTKDLGMSFEVVPELKMVFTNYKSPFYSIRDDESEFFAQAFVNIGCKHLEDITLKVADTIGWKNL